MNLIWFILYLNLKLLYSYFNIISNLINLFTRCLNIIEPCIWCQEKNDNLELIKLNGKSRYIQK